MPGSIVERRKVAQTAGDARLVVLMSIGLHGSRVTDRSIDPDACAVKGKDWAGRPATCSERSLPQPFAAELPRGAGLVASLIPLRRAGRVDPVRLLRLEQHRDAEAS